MRSIMNTNKSLPSYILILLLAVVFLSMPWTSVHIHVAENHSHDGIHHQHQSETHSHSLLADTDFSHQANHADAVELDNNYRIEKPEKQTASLDVIASSTFTLTPLMKVSNKRLIHTSTASIYCCYSNLNPRAPPKKA